MIDLTDEQKEFLKQKYENRPTYSPTLDFLNYNTPKRALQVIDNKENLLSDATQVLKEPLEDATDEEKLEYRRKKARFDRANAMLDLANAVGQNENKDFNLQKDLENFYRQVGSRYAVDENTLAQLWSYQQQKRAEKVLDENGLLPMNVLKDPQFQQNVDISTLSYYGAAYNTLHRSEWTDEVSRTWDAAKQETDNTLSYYNGEKSFKDYQEDQAKISALYRTDSDRDYIGGVSSTLSTMWQGFTNDPVNTFIGVGALVGGTLLSPFTAGISTYGGMLAFAGLTQGTLTYKMSMAEMQSEVQSVDPNLDVEKFRDETKWYAVGAGAIDTLDSAITFGLGGAAKGLTGATKFIKNHIVQNAIKDAGKVAAQTGNVAIKERVAQVVRNVGGAYLLDVGSEVTQEGAQTALTTQGVNDFYDRTFSDSWERDWQAFKSGAEQAFVPSLVISGLMMSPKLLGSIGQFKSLNKDLSHNLNTQVAAEYTAATPLAQKDQTTSNEVTDNVLQHSFVFIDPERAVQILDNSNFNEQDYGKLRTDLQAVQNGDSYKMTVGEYAHLKQEVRDALSPIATDKDGKHAPVDIQHLLSDERISELKEEFAEKQTAFSEREKQRIEIETDINKQLYETSKQSKVKFNNSIGQLVSTFITSMSEATGIEIGELYKLFKPTFIKQDVKAGESGTFNPQTNTIGLNETSDLQSIFHETSHWFLQTMKTLALNPKYTKVREQVNALLKWSGSQKTDISQLTEEEFNAFSEKFVAGFIYSVLSNQTQHRLQSPLIKTFERFLGSIRNWSIFSEWQRHNAKTSKAEHYKQGFEQRYNTALPPINSDFTTILDGLFHGETLSEFTNMDYPVDNVLRDIDSMNVDPELKEQLKTALKSELSNANTEIHDAIQTATVKQALQMLVHGKTTAEVENFIQNVIANLDNTMRNKREVMRYLTELLQQSKRYPALVQENLEAIANKANKNKMSVYALMARIKRCGGVNGEGLDKRQISALKEKGLYSESGVPVSVYFEHDPNTPKVLKRYAATSKLPFEQAAANFLIKTPTPLQLAQRQATKTIQESFYKSSVQNIANLTRTISRVHKRYARSLLECLAKSFGKDAAAVERSVQEIELIAEQDVDSTSYRQNNSSRYLGNARRANAKVKNALTKGELEGRKGAIAHTRNEYYQNHKAEYAAKRSAGILDRLNALKKLALRSDKKLSAYYDPELIAIIKIALAQIGFTQTKPHVVVEDLKQLVSRYPEMKDSIEGMIDKLSNSPTLHRQWQDSNFNELDSIIEMCEAAKGIARNVKVVTINGEVKNREAVAGEMVQSLDKHKDKADKVERIDKNKIATTKKKDNLVDIVRNTFRFYWQGLQLVEHFCQQVDKKITGGIFHTAVFQMGKQAETDFKVALNKYNEKFKAAFAKYKFTISDEQIETPLEFEGKKIVLGGGKFTGASTLELLGILLHSGANLRKLLNGYIPDNPNLTNAEQQYHYKKGIFDNWIQSLIDTGKITEPMLDFVQEIWNINEEISVSVQDASRLNRGYPFKKVEHRIFTVKIKQKDGTVKEKKLDGGYVPALANKDLVDPIIKPDEDLFTNLQNLEAAMPCQNPSFLQDRTAVARPLELDPRILINQYKDTVRYATVMPKVVQIKRLLDTPEVRSKLDAKYPDAYDNILMPWLKSLALMSSNLGGTNTLLSWVQRLTRSSAMAIMALNVNNTLQQISNIPTVLIRCGGNPIYLYKGLMYFFNADNRQKIRDESAFMRIRLSESHDSINELFEELILEGERYKDSKQRAQANWQATSQWINQHGYVLQHSFQNVLDYISYMATKEYALKNGMTEEQAIKYAESAVRQTLGSFDLADVSRVQKANPLVKTLTMFVGYFINMARLCETEISVLANNSNSSVDKLVKGGFVVMCSMVAPAVIAELINQAVGKGEFEWEEDEDWDLFHSNILWSPLRMYSTAFPLVGKVVDFGLNALQGKQHHNDSMIALPWANQIEGALKASEALVKSDKKFRGRDLRAMVTLALMCGNVAPAAALMRPVSYGFDLARGGVDPIDDSALLAIYELIRGPVTGTPSKHTKTGDF